ncbi:MAG: NAD(P)/FAD-dependent oxidoreductase [Deltaproteobacteria bacterium]|nr:NAD(P)/FAD-dependent oxidoreductase [Deltaproteobacteria bacterium]
MHDVVVVGGGPAGCHAASLLGQRGFDVHLLEEHETIGEPVDCSGVIGFEAFEALGLPARLKLGEIRTLTLVSPSELEVRFSPPSPLACVVNRGAFDRALAAQTRSAGVTFHLGTKVADLRLQDGCVEILFKRASGSDRCGSKTGQSPGVAHLSKSPQGKIKARMAILAGGPRYGLQRRLGMGRPADFLKTAQTEAKIQGFDEARVFMGSRVAPGSFAWIVPFQKSNSSFARIGVSAKVAPLRFLRDLLARLRSRGHLDCLDIPIRSWVIPVRPLRRTYAERVLAVGDAAGQTKPTTGGGIVYALLSAEAAAETAAAAFERGDFSAAMMRTYQHKWRKRLGREIRIGAFFRRLAERLTDQEIDDLFRIVLSDGVLRAVTTRARFDWHRDVISFALRHPALGRIFLRGLFR